MATMDDAAAPLALLCLESEDSLARTLEASLHAAGFEFTFEHVQRLEQALVRLQGGSFDVVVIAHDLGVGRTGLDVLKYLRDREHDEPVVILAADEGEALVENCLRYGADAFLGKDELDPDRVRSIVEVALTAPHRNAARILHDEA